MTWTTFNGHNKENNHYSSLWPPRTNIDISKSLKFGGKKLFRTEKKILMLSSLVYIIWMIFRRKNCFQKKKKLLPDGELNPGLPRDRRGYWPLYYRGQINGAFLMKK